MRTKWLCFTTAFSLCACGGTNGPSDGTSDARADVFTADTMRAADARDSSVFDVPSDGDPGLDDVSRVETADAGDDVCDERIGAGCGDCAPATTRSCYAGPAGTAGIGRCRAGTQTCGSDRSWGLTCVGEVRPGAVETCNGEDDDCNGVIDEGLGMTACGIGACRRTVENCAGGTFQTCTPGMPTAESCNGRDDDCNGSVDDGLAPFSCGVGACRRTVASCVAGMPVTCAPAIPTTETCNGIDDDCNGVVDDNLPTSTCGIGACRRTMASCVLGTPVACVPGAPSSESCNGVDDDCNGAVDDGLPAVACGIGACRRTVPACTTGMPTPCTPGAPTTESCNGIDDDCNGTVDDGIPPLACGTGACRRTAVACTTGLPGVCTPGTSVIETCNGVDDDCNGVVDDLPPLSCGLGACRRTAVACVAGAPGPCIPGAPTTETCNGIDDNCNGTTDEGCPSGIAFGPVSPYGPSGGSRNWDLFSDSCPSGQVLIGATARASSSGDWPVYGVQGWCGTAAIGRSASAPYTYSFDVTSAGRLPARGDTFYGTAYSLLCPMNAIVTGIDGVWGGAGAVYSIRLRCTSFTVTGTPGSYTVMPSSTSYTASTPLTLTGLTPYSHVCPSSGGATTLFGSVVSGCCSSSIESIGMGCSPLSVTLR